MPARRIKLAVYVNLDPVQGVMHTSQSAVDNVQYTLSNVMGHYNPKVDYEDIQEVVYPDRAVLVTETNTGPGGIFFMNDEAVVGYYCVRSEDPIKRDLFLPAYIFDKCFRFINETDRTMMPEMFCLVKEL